MYVPPASFQHTLRSWYDVTESRPLFNAVRWVQFENANVYLRLTKHFYDFDAGKQSSDSRGLKKTIDIGNIAMAPRYRRQGTFDRLLAVISDTVPSLVIYVENVFPEWVPALERRGFILCYPWKKPLGIDQPSLYRLPKTVPLMEDHAEVE